MKKIILHFTISTACFFLCYNTVQAQSKRTADSLRKEPAQIEITPYVKYDTYPEMIDRVTSTTHYAKISGLSYGLDFNIRIKIYKKYSFLSGIGYYKQSFNKIESRSSYGEGNTRWIDYPSPLFINFYTDKYWYHTFLFNVGVEKEFVLKKNLSASIGAVSSSYFTFSQYYHLNNNPGGSLDYKTNGFRHSGSTFSLIAGLQKTVKNILIGPKLIFPIYTKWKKDNAFAGETYKGSRDKWLRGIGGGISVNYFLISKKK